MDRILFRRFPTKQIRGNVIQLKLWTNCNTSTPTPLLTRYCIEERLMIQMWVNVIGQQKNRTSSRYTSTCGSIGTLSSFSSGPTAICVKLRKSILFIYLTFAIGKIVWWLENSTLPYNYVRSCGPSPRDRDTPTLLLVLCKSKFIQCLASKAI